MLTSITPFFREKSKMSDRWFPFNRPSSPAEWVDVPVIGALPEEKGDVILKDAFGPPFAEDVVEEELRVAGVFGRSSDRLWRHTDHIFGFLPSHARDGVLVHAGDIEPDMSLIGRSVKLTLNRLRVARYPGGGLHRVLFDFYVQNHVSNNAPESVHFNQVFRVMEGEGAGVIGYPIFVGLNIGPDGLSFRAFTVNVSNDADDALLSALDSDVVKNGLRLATVAQPALQPFSQLALGIVRAVAGRNKNIPVQDVFVGLDFATNAAGARLRQGDYFVVQIPTNEADAWRWPEWHFDRGSGLVTRRSTGQQIPYNYFVLGVTSLEAPQLSNSSGS